MLLHLSALPATTRGIYDVSGKGPNSLPESSLRLHPHAAEAFLRLEDDRPLVYSGIWRSAEQSLRARATKEGVQPPGYSGHNYGFSVDVAVEATLKRHAWSYSDLLVYTQKHGWYCHRRQKRGFEEWHFNFLPDPVAAFATVKLTAPKTWANAIESVIHAYYGSAFEYDARCMQEYLQKLRFYGGAIDGLVGPRTTEAQQAFSRAWRTTKRTFERTLAFVAADIQLS